LRIGQADKKEKAFMKSILKFGWALLFSIAIPLLSHAQTAQNLVAGVGPITNGVTGWNGTSVTGLISGTSLFPASGKQTVLYLGFTGGTSLEIGNMVLYKTNRNSLKIVSVTPVTYKGSASNTILLDSSNCRAVPPSTVVPCIVRLDPLNLKLSTLNDYYFVMNLPNTLANQTVNSTTSLFSNTTITGGFDFNDDTRLLKGDLLPANIANNGRTFFLVAVMNN
jgi:hypothetical protein